MKKLFTLIALFAVALGAKAEWVEDYKIDYSQNTGFPFYVMGYVPEWFDGVMTDFGAMYKYVQTFTTNDQGEQIPAEETSDVIVKTQAGVEYYKIPLESPGWHQYFIADGIPTELDGSYTVKAMVKASEACTINVNMGWGWGEGQSLGTSVAIGTEWEEVEWQYTAIGGSSCNLVAQPGTVTATIEWKWLTVSHNQKETRPTTWQEWLTSDGQPVVVDGSPIATYMGDAETPWSDPDVKFNDQEKNFLICAWGKEKGVNMAEEPDANGNYGWNPFPATIEDDGTGNHVFVVHAKLADTEGDASQWDNQFWIQSPKEWKSGTQVKLHFRYKANRDGVKTNTQIHHQNPSDYLIWHAIGDVTFNQEWQDFDQTFTFSDDMGGGWSIAFNLNAEVKDPVDFYFDDLSWQTMVLDEGLFIAASNTETGIEYDFDNAQEFVYDEELEAYVATVGTPGDQDSWVNEVMISTIRGNDTAFKGATLKPLGAITGDADDWPNYTEAALAKIKLPAAGVWKIAVDTDPDHKQMNFEKIEGEDNREPIEVIPNPTEIVVDGQERDYLTADNDGNPREDEIGTGEAWDNQFWIYADRALDKGEVTVLKFRYKASREAKVSTQCHGEPGAYLHWGAIGDVNFTTEWQEFETTFTVPSEADGMRSIAFNMAEIKEACTYEITDVVWILEDETETLIQQEGDSNFFMKVGAGTSPFAVGINSVVNKKAVSTAAYNLAGQRVTEGYRGIVIQNGKKSLVK